jgi:hypothetical protein
MKTSLLFFLSALLMTTAAWSQNGASVFENASLAKTPGSLPCMLLNWKKGEENTAYYLVERSADGKAFKTVAVVFTAEDPAFCSYAFRDQTQASAKTDIYYRIGLVNGQKEVTYLPVRKASFAANSNDPGVNKTSSL